MADVSVSAEWRMLYNRYYRKLDIYQMLWKQIDLSRYKVACAPFGGPIAVIRDDSKIVQLHAESAMRKLRIFNSAGDLIAETVWKHLGGRMVGLSWTDDQTLVCVVQDGTIYRYDVHAELISPNLSLGEEFKAQQSTPLEEAVKAPAPLRQSVVECVFWGTGVVCLSDENKLFCIEDFETPEVFKLQDVEMEDRPICMAVIEPKLNGGFVRVLLAVGDHVLVVEQDHKKPEEKAEVQHVGFEYGPLQKMAVSQDGKYVASFTHDGRLLVLESDFSDVVFAQSCESVLPPEHLAWCGLDSVLLYWDDDLLIYGPYGEPVSFPCEGPIVLIPECDGVRILSNSKMEFVHLVRDSTVSIFNIGSTLPAALLYDALDHYDRRSSKADENLRLIRSSLPEAVEACIDAAGHEFDISRQRTLLRAASYGMAFCSLPQRDRFREMCKTLRVLNAVRNPVVGIPLSIQQYKSLTPPVLIDRLVNSHNHLLAWRIAGYLGMNPEMVVMNWACSKITASLAIPDATLLEKLLDKLRLCKGISYAAVAEKADKSGRRKLSSMLIEHEPHSSKQVPLLLSIGEEDTALTKASESGDTDLVYLVLFHIWQKRSPLEFFGTIQAKTLARDLYICYSRCYKHEDLKDFFLSIEQFTVRGDTHAADKLYLDVAFLLWKESWELGKNPMASKGSALHGPRIKLIEQAQHIFLKTKEHTFEAKAAEEHAKLLRIQQELEVVTKQPIFVDSSISDTIRTCIVLGNHKAAERVKNEFKVSEKRWYWLKVFALATIRDWVSLEKFSAKRSPIGYKPFVEACIDAGEKTEAVKYIQKLADPRERAEAYARIDMAKEAADAASQAKDGELLGRLKLSFAQNAAASAIFDTLRDRLGSL